MATTALVILEGGLPTRVKTDFGDLVLVVEDDNGNVTVFQGEDLVTQVSG